MNEGYNNITVSKVAAYSGIARFLIYSYFGGLKGLMKAYLKQIDFWKLEDLRLNTGENSTLPDITKDFMFDLLKKDFLYFQASVEMQKIVLWEISEKNKLLRALSDEREEMGKHIFQKADEIFGSTVVDYPATTSIFISAIYYMVLHAKNNGSTMCGIDISTNEGQHRILNAINRLLSLTYKYAHKQL